MIYHFKSLVLVRKGRAFYATLYQEVFFGNPGGGGSLSMMPVKKFGLVLQDPVTSSNDKYLSLLRARSELIGVVTGEREFPTTDHLLALREERRDGQKS